MFYLVMLYICTNIKTHIIVEDMLTTSGDGLRSTHLVLYLVVIVSANLMVSKTYAALH